METGKNGDKKKSYLLLIVSVVLFIISLAITIYAHGHSYKDSAVTSAQLSEVRGLLKEIDAGEATGDVEALKARQTELSDLKLSQERPYSYGLTALFMSLLLVAKGLYNALVGTVKAQEDIKRLAMAGLMAALCYIGFAVFQIVVYRNSLSWKLPFFSYQDKRFAAVIGNGGPKDKAP